MKADRLAKLDQYEADARAELEPAVKPLGQPKKPRTKARERLARELGVLPETLRKKEWKAKRREQIKGPGLRSLGMNLSKEFKLETARAQLYIDQCDDHLKTAMGRLRAMKTQGVNFPEARLEHAWEQIKEVAEHVRGLRPVSLCPWCKGMDGIQEACIGCSGSGYITASQEHAVPLELLDEEEPKVVKDGKVIRLGSAIPLEVDGPTDEWGLGE